MVDAKQTVDFDSADAI